ERLPLVEHRLGERGRGTGDVLEPAAEVGGGDVDQPRPGPGGEPDDVAGAADVERVVDLLRGREVGRRGRVDDGVGSLRQGGVLRGQAQPLAGHVAPKNVQTGRVDGPVRVGEGRDAVNQGQDRAAAGQWLAAHLRPNEAGGA